MAGALGAGGAAGAVADAAVEQGAAEDLGGGGERGGEFGAVHSVFILINENHGIASRSIPFEVAGDLISFIKMKHKAINTDSDTSRPGFTENGGVA
jgi:hypothetical protein